MAARKPAPKAKEIAGTSTLLQALQFIEAAQSPAGTLYETHIVLSNKWATAYNGRIAAGAPIQEEFTACPQSAAFLQALSRCGSQYILTQIDGSKLRLETDKFKAYVPCADIAEMQRAYPDAASWPLTDDFRKSAKLCQTEPFAGENRIFDQTIMVRRNSCISTNGRLLIEHWHGIDMPTMAVPREFIEAVAKTKKTLVKFGCSNHSFTVHYDDGSWLRTQLYVDPWPDFDRLLNEPSNPFPVPPALFDGLRAIVPFLEKNSAVAFDADLLRSHNVEQVGATYKVPGLPAGPIFHAKQLLELEALQLERIDFLTGGRAFFFGPNVRGILIGMRL